MRRTVAPVILAALTSAASPALAADVSEYIGRFAVMNPALAGKSSVTRPCACGEKETGEFWDVFLKLQGESDYGHGLRGKATLGFQGDDSRAYGGPAGSSESAAQNDPSRYQLNLGLNLRRGTYPGEFKFDAGLNVTLEGSALKQSVREILVAYDHWLTRWVEGFVFGSQFTDSYMRIDQRYEVGTGVFVGGYFFANPAVDPKWLLLTPRQDCDIERAANVTIRYRRIFDNIPPFYQPADGASTTPFVIAADTHTIVTVNFGISW
jgi:hypothetical protein